MQNSKKKISKFFKRLRGISLKNLHAEFNRIWFFLESIDERLKKLEGDAGVQADEKSDKEIAAETFNSITSDVTPEKSEDNQDDKIDPDKIARDEAFARAKELGLSPHHKTSTDNVIKMIEEKEKEDSVE